MAKTLITNALLVNEGTTQEGDVLIDGERISKIATSITADASMTVVDAQGRILMPGMIDDQVHFREPGAPHKANMASESVAAVAGGTTSFMDMPNTNPTTTTRQAVADKYDRAAGRVAANYAFYLGATNNNIDEIRALKIDEACGVKVFMGASTGNMLVDNQDALAAIFRDAPGLIATHCEDTPTILNNEAQAAERYGDALTAEAHPAIRSAEACWLSSSMAVGLAKEHGARLHVLHRPTAREMELFDRGPVESKRITAEACVHHLWFSDADYPALGNLIKCNPAIKSGTDRAALRQALLDDRLDVIATDHAPHTREEKAQPYPKAPAGLPLVQTSLVSLLDHVNAGWLPLTTMVHKACHAPALCYGVQERGYLREGYYADLTLANPDATTTVTPESILYHCGWSPYTGTTFRGRIDSTWVNGALAFDGQTVIRPDGGQRLRFAAA
ncbi:MAG: dihydroorotase [Xanthomonadales bacterium]|nr:dihydroorotase [Xanthomonadales bacterium]